MHIKKKKLQKKNFEKKILKTKYWKKKFEKKKFGKFLTILKNFGWIRWWSQANYSKKSNFVHSILSRILNWLSIRTNWTYNVQSKVKPRIFTEISKINYYKKWSKKSYRFNVYCKTNWKLRMIFFNVVFGRIE